MNLVCINCPRGCNLVAEIINDEVVVSGNACIRGKQYATSELTDPKRTLTTTVTIDSKMYSKLPVISSSPIPREKIMDVVKALKEISVKAPININDVVVKNILGLDIDIIASKSILD